MANVYDATGRKIASVGNAARAGYAAATGGLDQYGPDIPVHPFGQTEIIDRGSGIARVVAEMISARRGIANAREARQREETRKERDALTLEYLKNRVAATTPGAKGAATDKTRMPIGADRAAKYGITSFVPDPDDPTKGTADIHEATMGRVDTASAMVDKRVRDRAKEVDERINGLADKRLAARSKASEYRLALSGLDKEASLEGEKRATDIQRKADFELAILNNTRGMDAKGKLLSDEAFRARHQQAASFLGLSPKWDKDLNEPVKDSKTGLYQYDVKPATIEMLVKRARQRGIKDIQKMQGMKRAGIQAMIDKYIGLDKTLGGMQQGLHTGEGQNDDWNIDAPAVDDPNAPPGEPLYDDPAKILKDIDDEED